MNDDVNLIGTHAEQPARFDDFEAFVHHGSGVDSNTIAHFPVGVSEGLIDGDLGELSERRFAEWTAGSGKDDAADLGVRGSGE